MCAGDGVLNPVQAAPQGGCYEADMVTAAFVATIGIWLLFNRVDAFHTRVGASSVEEVSISASAAARLERTHHANGSAFSSGSIEYTAQDGRNEKLDHDFMTEDSVLPDSELAHPANVQTSQAAVLREKAVTQFGIPQDHECASAPHIPNIGCLVGCHCGFLRDCYAQVTLLATEEGIERFDVGVCETSIVKLVASVISTCCALLCCVVGLRSYSQREEKVNHIIRPPDRITMEQDGVKIRAALSAALRELHVDNAPSGTLPNASELVMQAVPFR